MMTKYVSNIILDESDVEDNVKTMYSYGEVRELLISLWAKSRGKNGILLSQAIDVIDLACENAVNSYKYETIESEIYSILSQENKR